MIEKIKDSYTRNEVIRKKWAGPYPRHPGPLSATKAADVHRAHLPSVWSQAAIRGGPLQDTLPAPSLCLYNNSLNWKGFLSRE